MNNKISWNSNMSVGIEEIDNQHKVFVQIISDLHSAFYDNKSKEELENILNKLIDYAKSHFETEERYFEKFNYELKEEHEQKHNELKLKTFDFKERFGREGTGIIPEFIDFLIDWLVDHMETEDQKYVKCFHDHGL